MVVLLRGKKDVGRLDVAVDEPARVGRVERASDLDRGSPSARAGSSCASVASSSPEVGPLHVAHCNEQEALGLAGLVDRDHVRVVDRGSEPRLAQEPLAEALVLGQLGGEQLQRDLAAEPRCPRPGRQRSSRPGRAAARSGSRRAPSRSAGSARTLMPRAPSPRRRPRRLRCGRVAARRRSSSGQRWSPDRSSRPCRRRSSSPRPSRRRRRLRLGSSPTAILLDHPFWLRVNPGDGVSRRVGDPDGSCTEGDTCGTALEGNGRGERHRLGVEARGGCASRRSRSLPRRRPRRLRSRLALHAEPRSKRADAWSHPPKLNV